jgi:predicted TIM-barrel fold metal-dependent hydrolase
MMETVTKTRSAGVRERLSHPVIDADGHVVEIVPVLQDYIREVGGQKVLERYQATQANWNVDGGDDRVGGPRGWYGLSPKERRDRRVTRAAFWSYHARNTLDRATVTIPNLYRARLDELGIDFAILYPTVALRIHRYADDELRRVGCRAYNRMMADLYRPHASRMTPAAVIPMNTPQEAIDELEYSVRNLGLKVVVLATNIRRPIPEVARRFPELASYATWMDVLALGSDYDYDPVWQKCVDLRVAATTHTSSIGWGPRTSPENYCYNHIGHFAAAGEAFCKALVIGGVVQRFPMLTFAFLEGGVGWACSLYNDLIEHWEKRNLNALHENLDPSLLDRALLSKLFRQYGGDLAAKYADAFATSRAPNEVSLDVKDLDEWSALKIESARDFAKFFSNFYFGCEADDRMSAVAFNPKLNHFGAKMQAIFSSDVGHWDVPDIGAVVAEAYELVERDLLTEEDFCDFTFRNAVKLHGLMNPDFFKGTLIQDSARGILA